MRARPIIGGEPFTLTTRCIDNHHTDLGPQVRSPEEVAEWAATCQGTPLRVDAGTQPSGLTDAAVDGDGEPLGRGDGKVVGGEESGCQLARGRSLASSLWLTLGLLALAGAKRRRGT